MAATLLLDRDGWDLCLDASGNIAMATEPYAQAQDIASEARVFVGECYYDTSRGLPYFTQILGKMQPVLVLKRNLADAAKRVPGVTNPVVYLTSIANRQIGGQIQFSGGIASL